MKGNNYLGGFVGYINLNNSNVTLVEQCYATGDLDTSNDNGYIGGFLGSTNSSYGKIINCFTINKSVNTNYSAGFAGYVTSYLSLQKCY